MWLIGLLATCEDCDWRTEKRNGMALAAHHYKKTGHCVHVEVYHGHRFGKSQYDRETENKGNKS